MLRHIANDCVLALNFPVPLLQGFVNVRLCDLVGRGRDCRCQRGVQLIQKLLMQPVMEGWHIKVQLRELQIIAGIDNAANGGSALQIGIFPVRIAAGVDEGFIFSKRVAHGQLVLLKQLGHGWLRSIDSRVTEETLCIVCI